MKINTFRIALISIMAMSLFFSCKKKDTDEPQKITLDEDLEEEDEEEEKESEPEKDNEVELVLEDSLKTLTPNASYAGLIITLTGENFSQVTTENEVYFNGVKADVLSATTNSLEVKVPEGGTSGLISVKVNGKRLANPLPFSYCTLPNPKIYNVCTKSEALQVSNFTVKTIELTNNNNLDFYVFRYGFTITNIGNKTIDIGKVILQASMSAQDNHTGSVAAGGSVYTYGSLAPGESMKAGDSGNSGFWKDPLDINNAYLLVEVKYPNCTELIAQQLKLK